MLKNKILFVLDRCEHDENQTSSSKNLSFLPTSSPSSSSISLSSTLKRPSTPTCEDEGYKIAFESPSSSEQSSKSRRTSNSRAAKEQRTSLSDALNIVEIEASAFHMLTSNKINKLFSITSSEIHNSTSSPFVRNSRISVNESCLCDSKPKYKKCYKLYTAVRVNNTKELTLENVKKKLSKKYHNFLNVFDRSKTNELSSHREYDHKLEFIDEADKIKLSRSRIYLISGPKLKQVKKYLNEHLKKGFIVLSQASFVSFILFAEKSNSDLRFCVDYRRLNQIIKRNRYLISLIDEVLTRIQNCKYMTRLNIIAAFNKLRMHSNSEDFIIFIISLEAYKYRVLSFELINEPVNYQQYMNDILFDYLNDFYQIYLNDILIYSKIKKEHVKHVRLILQRLREIDLQVDILKCEFHVQEIKFLRLLIFTEELRMNSSKVDAMVDWSTSINLKKTQLFVDFCNFYRRFIKNFSKIVKLLVRLTRKDVIFK